MKVTGTGGVGQAGGPRSARQTGGEGFRIQTPPSDAPAGSAGVGATGAVMGLDALIALQDVGGPLERRRRAARRANGILDVLEGVKLAMLDNNLSQADLQRLQRALREEREATGDPELEALLDEIETRAAVEIAKLEQAEANSKRV